MERATALFTQMEEAMGTVQGQMLKQQTGDEAIDVNAAYALAEGFVESLGITFEVTEQSPECVAFRVGKCPVFEGAQMLGMDVEAIEAACHAGALKFMEAAIKQLNPDLSYEVRKYRTSADDFCEEAIVLG